jgi:DNA-binding IclR family transcriptional regulator
MGNKSFQKFCRVLQCFTPWEPTWTSSALAAKLKMPVSTLHGILTDLAKEDFLAVSPVSKEFRIGFRYMEMGFLHANNFELNNIAQGIMGELVSKTGHLAGLSVMYKGWMYVAMSVLPMQNTIRYKYVGPRLPAHVTSGGLAILAHLPEKRLADYCEIQWEANMAAPRCSLEELTRKTRLIRKRGYAIGHTFSSKDTGETIGAPVFGRGGQILAGLVLLNQDEGFSSEQVTELAAALIPSAREISERSGHISPSHEYL